jgi:AraC-like DNA-binding protein
MQREQWNHGGGATSPRRHSTKPPIVLSDRSVVWTADAKWQRDAAVAGVIVMQGGAKVTTTQAPLRMTACTAVFLDIQPTLAIQFTSATALIWALPEGNASCLPRNKVISLDEVVATVVHDVFFEHNRPVEHQASALDLIGHQLRDTPADASNPTTSQSLVSQVMSHLQSHLDETITLASLATEFGYSKTVLVKRFQDEQGESPTRALARLRVAHARQLLQSTDLTISQIARATGYKDLAAFSHFFKQHAGYAPSEFRDQCLWLL